MSIEFVKKRNGRLDSFDPNKINIVAERACEGLAEVSPSELVLDAQLNLYDKIPTSEIDTALVMSAREKIQKAPEYNFVATRILFSTVYKDAFGDSVAAASFDKDYRLAFKKQIRSLSRSNVLQSDIAKPFDLDALASALVLERDDRIRFLGSQVLVDRYLIRDGKKVVETPQAFWMRVAMGVAMNEEHPTARAIEFYNLFSTQRYTPSTPTLFNSGLKNSQLSSCYLNTFEDSIDGIFEGVWQEAKKSKYAGGLGFDVTNFRAAGAEIDGTPDICKGLVPWLKLFNDMLIAVNQKGKRPGAGCAYLEPWHKDYGKFIELRKNTGDDRMRTHDMNIATWTPDLFMERIKENGDWYMFCPHDCPDLHELYGPAFKERYLEYCAKADAGEITNFTIVKAKALWKDVIAVLFETSHPWITFKDPSNMRYTNQHEGVVHSSNLCTEIIEHTKPSRFNADGEKIEVGETAVCNLGSINLKNHVKPVYSTRTEPITKEKYQHLLRYEVDWKEIETSVKLARRILDNVIDLNFYPTKESKKSNMRHRPVGLGVMGLHDMLHLLDIQIDSDEAIEFNDQLFEAISMNAIEAGADLAEERGAYPSYEGSLWSKDIMPIDTWKTFLDYRGSYPEDAHECLTDNVGKLTDDWKRVRAKIAKHGMRNSLSMAIAPTATIGDINGVEQSIEPNPSVLFVKENKSGNFYIVNEYFIEDMREAGLWNPQFADAVRAVDGDVESLAIPDKLKEKYASVRNRDMMKLIQCNAARQKWIDQAISFNVYYFGSSSKDINDIYMAAWEYGLKTTYYLRGTGASKIEKTTVNTGEMNLDNRVQRDGSVIHSTEQMPDKADKFAGYTPVDESKVQQEAGSPDASCSLAALMRGEICESCE